MSRDTYHALIVKHYPRSISAHADTIGEKASSPRYTIFGFSQMVKLTISPYVISLVTSRESAINISGNISPEVV